VVYVKAVATATLRSAPNGTEIVESIRERFGIGLGIIDGNMEAQLSFLGIKSSFDINRYNALITDIGGGSSEFVISCHGKIEEIHTKKLGGARLKLSVFCQGSTNPL